MQSVRHAPHRLGPPDRPGRRTSIAVISLVRDAFAAVVSLLLLPVGDIELNPRAQLLRLQKTHSSRSRLPAIPGQLLYKRATQATFLQRLPPVSADPPMKMSPSSPSAQISDPSHVPVPTVQALSTLQGNAAASPPAREGGYAGSIANQTAARKQSLASRLPRYNSKSSKSRTIQHADPAEL